MMAVVISGQSHGAGNHAPAEVKILRQRLNEDARAKTSMAPTRQ